MIEEYKIGIDHDMIIEYMNENLQILYDLLIVMKLKISTRLFENQYPWNSKYRFWLKNMIIPILSSILLEFK